MASIRPAISILLSALLPAVVAGSWEVCFDWFYEEVVGARGFEPPTRSGMRIMSSQWRILARYFDGDTSI